MIESKDFVFGNIRNTAKRMKKGEPEALYEMKSLLTYLETMDGDSKTLHEMVGKVRNHILITLYFVKKILTDLWINFSFDSAGFPENYAYLVFKNININLGSLILITLKGKGDEKAKFQKMSKVIFSYLKLLKKSEEITGKRVTLPDVDT